MDVFVFPGTVLCGSCGGNVAFEQLRGVAGESAVLKCENSACDRYNVRLLLRPRRENCHPAVNVELPE